MVVPSLEYLAGFFDGEGCVSTAHALKSHPCPKISVGQIDTEVLHAFRGRWGGVVHVGKEGKKRPVSRWGLSGPALVPCLRALLPYLRQKRKQAFLALTMQAMIRGRVAARRIHPNGQYPSVPAGEAWMRRRLAKAISNLNHGQPWDFERGPRDDETFVRL